MLEIKDIMQYISTYTFGIPLGFYPENDALAGQRDGTAPSVGH
jgi:hypothetical protein